MNKQVIKKQLKQLDFSQHEADVYLALIETGITSAGEVIKKTGLHRNVVYVTLDKLILKKLVIESNKKGVKFFRVSNVNRITKEKEQQFLLAQKIVPKLEKIKNESEIETLTYEGIDGFQTIHQEAVEQMKKNQTIYVLMAGGNKFYEFMGGKLKYFDKVRAQNKNKIKLLASREKTTDLEDDRTKTRNNIDIRYLPINFSNPIGSAVYGDKTLLFIYSDNPIVISIESKEVASAHEKHFKLLWNNIK